MRTQKQTRACFRAFVRSRSDPDQRTSLASVAEWSTLHATSANSRSDPKAGRSSLATAWPSTETICSAVGRLRFSGVCDDKLNPRNRFMKCWAYRRSQAGPGRRYGRLCP